MNGGWTGHASRGNSLGGAIALGLAKAGLVASATALPDRLLHAA